MIEDYYSNGFSRYEKLFNSIPNSKELNSDYLIKFLLDMDNFADGLESLGFLAYILACRSKEIPEKIASSASRTTQKMFGNFLNIKKFEEVSHICVFMLEGEIFILDFEGFEDNIEFCFMTPFSWYRAFEKDNPAYELGDSVQVPAHTIFVKGLDQICPYERTTFLSIISLRPCKIGFLLESLDGEEDQYFCPFITINENEIGEFKEIELVINKGGEQKILLVNENSDKSYSTILKFRKRFAFKEDLLVAIPNFYLAEKGRIISPKNRFLPIGKYVDFIVEFKGMLRIFVQVQKLEHVQKIELFKKDGLFTRNVLIEDTKLILIGELEHNSNFEIIAEYTGVEYSKIHFDGIDQKWLAFTDSPNPLTSYTPCKAQNTNSSHKPELMHELENLIQSNEILELLKSTKNIRTPNELIEKTKKEFNEELKQIVFVYLWINKYIAYSSEKNISEIPQAPKTVMKKRHTICRGFANLFKMVLNHLGIICFCVDGFVSTKDFFVSANHTWNVVKYKKYHYFVDLSGASFLMNSQNNLLKEMKINLQRFFIFTPPKNLLLNHFPEESCYSLRREYRFDINEVKNAPIIYPMYYALGIMIEKDKDYLEIKWDERVAFIRFECYNHRYRFSASSSPVEHEDERFKVLQRSMFIKNGIYQYLLMVVDLGMKDKIINDEDRVYIHAKYLLEEKAPRSVLDVSKYIYGGSPKDKQSNKTVCLMGLKRLFCPQAQFPASNLLLKNPIFNSKGTLNRGNSLNSTKKPPVFELLTPGSYYIPAGARIKFQVYWSHEDGQLCDLIISNIEEEDPNPKISSKSKNIISVVATPLKGVLHIGHQYNPKVYQMMAVDESELDALITKVVFN